MELVIALSLSERLLYLLTAVEEEMKKGDGYHQEAINDQRKSTPSWRKEGSSKTKETRLGREEESENYVTNQKISLILLW